MPVEPDAPVTFSITTGWPSAADMPDAMRRALVSIAPPAGTGTTMVIGARRKGLRARGARQHRQDGGARGQMQELTASKDHRSLSYSTQFEFEHRPHKRVTACLAWPGRLGVVAEMRAKRDAGVLVAKRLAWCRR